MAKRLRFIRQFLVFEVQVLDFVDDLAQLDRKFLLRARYRVQLLNLLLAILVDAHFVFPDKLQVLSQLLACSLENFSGVTVERLLNVLAKLDNQLAVPSAVLNALVIQTVSALRFDQLDFLLNVG